MKRQHLTGTLHVVNAFLPHPRILRIRAVNVRGSLGRSEGKVSRRCKEMCATGVESVCNTASLQKMCAVHRQRTDFFVYLAIRQHFAVFRDQHLAQHLAS